jgi:hypothetical protein
MISGAHGIMAIIGFRLAIMLLEQIPQMLLAPSAHHLYLR